MLNDDIKKYIDEKTEAFKKELNEEVKQMIKDTDQGQVKSVWELKHNDKCYALYGDGDIVGYEFRQVLEAFRQSGNIFLTKEEAELERERRKIGAVMRRYSRPFKNGVNNYCIFFYACESIRVGTLWAFNSGIPCFESKEIAQKVIDEIGKDKLKKYWFRVEE